MVKYTIDALQAMVGTRPTDRIVKINKSPTFITLYNLQRQLVGGLQKVANAKYPLYGHAGYILLREVFSLFSNKKLTDP